MEDIKYRIIRRTTRLGPIRKKTVTYKYSPVLKSDLQLEEDVFNLLDKIIDTYKQMSKDKQRDCFPQVQSRLDTLCDKSENPLIKARRDSLDTD